MRRRVTKGLRRLLVGLGVICVLWFPVSFFFAIEAEAGWDSSGYTTRLFSRNGAINAYRGYWFSRSWPVMEHSVSCQRHYLPINWSDLALPRYELVKVHFPGASYHYRVLTLPLWLLAAVCLAWPVTCFIVARRRGKGRGFEIEARMTKPETRMNDQ